MYDFFDGKNVNDRIAPWIHENLMLTETGMSLDEIRKMDYHDFQMHLIMIIARESIKSGYNPKSKKKAPNSDTIIQNIAKGKMGKKMIVKQKFNPETNSFE